MKRTTIAAIAAVVLLTLTGCAESANSAADKPSSPMTTEPVAPSETPEPLVAETPSAQQTDAAFLSFVRGRLATFPSQIPDATDEQLLDAAAIACERLQDGESVEKMSVIEGEQPSEVGGYFYDSNAIIAGAQMHLCADTLS